MTTHDVATIPRLHVEFDGRPLDETETCTLGEVRVRRQLSRSALCELRYIDPSPGFGHRGSVRVGSRLQVSQGPDRRELFAGEVTAIEFAFEPSRGREVRVRAYDLLHRLRKRQPVRSHVEVTLADLARELVSSDGLVVEEGKPGPIWQHLVQYRQTDFDLLAETAARSGHYFVLRGDTLVLSTLEGNSDAVPLALRLGQELLEARVAINGESTCQSVATLAWDPWLAQPRRGSASDARAGRDSGAAAPAERFGASGAWQLTGENAQLDAQAEAMAQAELDHRAASEVELDGVADGDLELVPGARVKIEGLTTDVDGEYVVATAEHRIDAEHGWVTAFSTRPPELQHRPWGTVLAWGVVTNVEDPEGLGRVSVRLPAFDDLESSWLAVALPGVGPGKGLLALPAVDDNVVALFSREDLAQGVVVGGLHGGTPPADDLVRGGTTGRFTFLTAGGQLVRLDDFESSLRLENGDGSSVELAPHKLTVHAACDLEITAPGKVVTISGSAINFERA